MNQPFRPALKPFESLIKNIRRATRRQLSSKETFLFEQGLRGGHRIAEPCRREDIASSIQYGGSKRSLDAGKRLLPGDTTRTPQAMWSRVHTVRRVCRRKLWSVSLIESPAQKGMSAAGSDGA